MPSGSRKHEAKLALDGLLQLTRTVDTQLEGERLRFWAGNALLLEPEEMNERLRGMLDGAQRRADEEVRRRQEAERRLAELQSELERLKSRGE